MGAEQRAGNWLRGGGHGWGAKAAPVDSGRGGWRREWWGWATPLGLPWHERPCSLRTGAGHTGDRPAVAKAQDTHGPEEIGLC